MHKKNTAEASTALFKTRFKSVFRKRLAAQEASAVATKTVPYLLYFPFHGLIYFISLIVFDFLYLVQTIAKWAFTIETNLAKIVAVWFWSHVWLELS